MCWYSIWALIGVPGAPLLIKIPDNGPGKATEDGSSAWAPVTVCQTQKNSPALGFCHYVHLENKPAVAKPLLLL